MTLDVAPLLALALPPASGSVAMLTAGVVAVAHQPPHVDLPSACPHRFRVGSAGTRLGRWFREVGYTAPIPTNDRGFDERWVVEAQDREFAETLLREQQARAAIARLGELECSSLSHDGRRLSAVLCRKRHGAAGQQQEQAVLEQLTVIGGVIARLCRHRGFPHRARPGRLFTAVVLLGFALAAGLLGLALGADELVDGELARLALRSLLYSVPVTVLFLAAMALLLAGSSRSHKDLGVAVLVAVIALPVLGVGGAVHVNRALDNGAATMHHLPVLELQEQRGEGSHRTCYAVVPAWREGTSGTERIRVRRQTADTIVPGTSWLRLTTSPGKLGAERLLGLVVESDGDGH